MTNSNGITAQLVFDGGDEVYIPDAMGGPREDQLLGTPAERLSELAGRVCYDSLGKGRASFSKDSLEGYHDHIKAVGHGSVQEHFNFTLELNFTQTNEFSETVQANRKMLVAWHCMNRPGVLVLPVVSPTGIRITTNLRSVREWSRWTRSFYGRDSDQFNLDRQIQFMMQDHANSLAPHVVDPPSGEYDESFWIEISTASVVEPISDHERWVSMYMTGSRGLSHELVRHGDFTAISQRSTRFVDESEGDWIEHPLATAFCRERTGAVGIEDPCPVIEVARSQYRACVDVLEPWLISRGLDRTSARKQARGAARGFLGNALQTELIFSASVSQWKWMLNQRASVFADAEIRELFCGALGELKRSRYFDRFTGWNLKPSPDGIGQVAVESAAP